MSNLSALIRHGFNSFCVGSLLMVAACSNNLQVSERVEAASVFDVDLGSVLELDSVFVADALTKQNIDGKVVYLDFWASWCAPCIQSLPILSDISSQYAGQGFEMISVNVDKDREKALAFIERLSLEFPVFHDPENSVMNEYEVTGLPTGLLINSKNEVVLTHRGFSPVDEKFLRARIDHEVRRQKFEANIIN